jgi:hypothetical protein
LSEDVNDQGEAVSDEHLSGETIVKEGLLDEMGSDLALAMATATPEPLIVGNCEYNYYVGPRSVIDNVVGAAAIIEVTCIGGSKEIAMSVTVCSNGSCATKSAKQNVGSAGYTLTAVRAAFSNCSAKVSFTPPGHTFTWSGPCG